MIPDQQQIEDAAHSFASKRFDRSLKGVAKSSFVDGAEYVLSQLADNDDASIQLSKCYSSLKEVHWERKRLTYQLEKENAQLRKELKELRIKFLDVLEQLNSKFQGKYLFDPDEKP